MGDHWKNRILLTVGLVLLLGLSTFEAVAQEANGEDKGNENENEIPNDPEGSSEGGQGYTEMFGQFELDGSGPTGRFVSFEIEEGSINDYEYALEDEIIFSSIGFTVDPFTEDTAMNEGAVYHAELDGLHFMSHNNPTAMIHVTYSGDGSIKITLVPAEGVSFGEIVDGVIPILGLSSEAEISPGTEDLEIIDGSLEINIIKGVIVSFTRIPYQTMSSFQENIIRAVQVGKIDGEMQIMSKEGETVESQYFPYEGKVLMQMKDSEKGNMLKVEVQSQEKAGKVLMFRVHGEMLDNADVGKVSVYFDGEKGEMVRDIKQVLSGNTDKCMYYIDNDEDGNYQAMVFVPEFSTHEVSFQVEGDTVDSPVLMVGTIILFGLMISLFLYIFRKNRK